MVYRHWQKHNKSNLVSPTQFNQDHNTLESVSLALSVFTRIATVSLKVCFRVSLSAKSQTTKTSTSNLWLLYQNSILSPSKSHPDWGRVKLKSKLESRFPTRSSRYSTQDPTPKHYWTPASPKTSTSSSPFLFRKVKISRRKTWCL